jgi:flagellar motor protein MotB
MGTTGIGGISSYRFTGFLAASALAVFSTLGTGCQNKMYDENTALREQNRELQAKIDERNTLMQSAMPVSNVVTPAEVRPVTPPPLAPVVPPPAPVTVSPVSVQPEPPALPIGGSDLTGLDTTENKITGTMTVKFLGDELFDPGQATLKESSKKDLNKVAAALKKQYSSRPVHIEGHTDSDPIKHSKWASNMELSKARADEVRRYLVSKGVNASQVSTQGFGDTKPKSTKPTDKAKNRRVEIVVLAK